MEDWHHLSKRASFLRLHLGILWINQHQPRKPPHHRGRVIPTAMNVLRQDDGSTITDTVRTRELLPKPFIINYRN